MIPEILLFFNGLFPVIGTINFFLFLSDFCYAKKAKNFFPFYRSFSPFSLFSLQHFYLHFSTYHWQPVWKEKLFTFIIVHNYETMLVIILGNLNIYVVKLKKSQNNSAPSWFRTCALVVRRLERRPLTCEAIPTALRLLLTWPTAWDAPFSYEFYFENPYCCWWNCFPTVKKQICFSKCRFYIAIYRWSIVNENFIKPLF